MPSCNTRFEYLALLLAFELEVLLQCKTAISGYLILCTDVQTRGRGTLIEISKDSNWDTEKNNGKPNSK